MTTVVSPVEASVSDLVGIGRVLQQGRVEKGMTKESVAQELHLHIRQISALESGDFSGFSSPAFIKGYLRACAKLYGLNGDNLVNLYASLLPPPQKTYMPAAAVSSQKIILVSSRSNKTLLFFLLVIALLAGVACALWFGFRNWPLVLSDKVETAAEPIPEIPAAPPEIPAALVVADASVVQPYETPSIMAPPSQEMQDSALHIEFTDDCWVQLKADDGKTLLDKTYKKGEILDMPVKTPLRVWFGRAAAVNVSYNGAVVDVPIKPGFQSAQFVLGDESLSRETE